MSQQLISESILGGLLWEIWVGVVLGEIVGLWVHIDIHDLRVHVHIDVHGDILGSVILLVVLLRVVTEVPRGVVACIAMEMRGWCRIEEVVVVCRYLLFSRFIGVD